jgi:hypothetical protein
MAERFDPRKYLGDIKGRAYLDVSHRLLWLNDQQAQFDVTTELLHYDDKQAVVRATITLHDDAGQTVRRATAHGRAHVANMAAHIQSRYLEKAETAAVGRALGMVGLGTLAAQEFDDTEGGHLADTPAARIPAPAPPSANGPAPAAPPSDPAPSGQPPAALTAPVADGDGTAATGSGAPPEDVVPIRPLTEAEAERWAKGSPLNGPPARLFEGGPNERAQAFLRACRDDIGIELPEISRLLGGRGVRAYMDARKAEGESLSYEQVFDRLWRRVHLDEPLPGGSNIEEVKREPEPTLA